jgi:chromosome condensin MukBEF MukE localization factor
MSDTPERTAREMTDTIIDTLELKIRAGEWVSLEAVRREFHTLITSYEQRLEKLHDLCNRYENRFARMVEEAMGEEE